MPDEGLDGTGSEETESGGEASPADPTDEAVVHTAAEAAEGVVFAHYDQSTVTDLDVTVTFEDGVLDVDVYLNAPGPDDPDTTHPDPEAVAAESVDAAGDAVDELFGE